MKTFGICLLILFAFATALFAGGPSMDNGLSVHMIPDTFPFKGGFVVVASTSLHEQPAKPFQTAKEVFAFITAHLKETEDLQIRRHGIWIYAEDPVDICYTPAARKQYNELLSLCAEKNIPVGLGFTKWRPALPEMKQKP